MYTLLRLARKTVAGTELLRGVDRDRTGVQRRRLHRGRPVKRVADDGADLVGLSPDPPDLDEPQVQERCIYIAELVELSHDLVL